MSEPIEPQTVFTASDGLEITEVPDGRVVYQSAREKVHYLNPTAIIVLELCGTGQTIGEVASFLQDAYNLPELPTAEVTACVASLLAEELLCRSSP